MSVIILNDDKYIQDILEIENNCFSIPWSKNVFIDEFNKNIATYVGILIDGKVVAYGGFWKIIDEAHITNIAVHPDFRNLGYAKQIIYKFFEICDKDNILALTLEVRASNEKAIELYKSFGFCNCGTRKGYYEDNKEDAIIMWKTL